MIGADFTLLHLGTNYGEGNHEDEQDPQSPMISKLSLNASVHFRNLLAIAIVLGPLLRHITAGVLGARGVSIARFFFIIGEDLQ